MSKLRERPESLPSVTLKVDTSLGSAFITLTWDAQGAMEVFVNIGRSGSDRFAMSEAIGRLISTLLRLEELGTPVQRLELIIEQLSGIGGSRPEYKSVPAAIAEALNEAKRHSAPAEEADRTQLADAQSTG